jgi:hypothetical protein
LKDWKALVSSRLSLTQKRQSRHQTPFTVRVCPIEQVKDQSDRTTWTDARTGKPMIERLRIEATDGETSHTSEVAAGGRFPDYGRLFPGDDPGLRSDLKFTLALNPKHLGRLCKAVQLITGEGQLRITVVSPGVPLVIRASRDASNGQPRLNVAGLIMPLSPN